MGEEVSGLIRTGAIEPATLIWNESMTGWKPAKEVMPQWFEGANSGAAAITVSSSVPSSAPDAPIDPQTPPAQSGSPAASPVGTASSQGLSGAPSAPSGGLAFSPPTVSRPQQDPLAILSMISGITGIVMACLTCFPIIGACFGILAFIGGVAAVIMGHMSLSHLKKAGDAAGGRGMAMTGLICGYTTVGLAVVGIIFAFVFVGAANSGALDRL
jgi:hypothetical protein